MRASAPVPMRRQRGAFLIMMVIMVVVLIGIAALALDVGRVVALRAEMQNAVDAAALAAAVELDGKDGAQDRARAAAREALVHDSRYARVAELLGDTSLPDGAFDFFCIISSKQDVDPTEVDMTEFCEGDDLGDGTWSAAGDGDSHYVRVRLDPSLVEEHFTVDLIFLPVLRLVNVEPQRFVAIHAAATAGRHWYECNYPPMVICDPFEGTGTTFKEAMSVGQQITLREQGPGASWVPGNFGFLQPRGTEHGGATDVSVYLADANLMGCTPPVICTKTGEMAQKTKAAINTRFDEYGSQLPKVPDSYPPGTTRYTAWPPAPNVVEFTNDQTFRLINGAVDDRFGNGDWNFEAYWAARHPGVVAPSVDGVPWSNTNRPSRYDVYAWEVANNAIPAAPTHTAGALERRVLFVAVASCGALDLKGNTCRVMMDPDGFAKMFVYRKADNPSNRLNIFAEYMGWSMEQDAHYHVDIQLYQ